MFVAKMNLYCIYLFEMIVEYLSTSLSHLFHSCFGTERRKGRFFLCIVKCITMNLNQRNNEKEDKDDAKRFSTILDIHLVLVSCNTYKIHHHHICNVLGKSLLFFFSLSLSLFLRLSRARIRSSRNQNTRRLMCSIS